MNRKAYILLLMYAAWPINLVHRFWNNRLRPPVSFPFDATVINVQEYFFAFFGLLSWIFIFWATWLYINGNYRQDKDFKIIFAAHFINLLIDLPHFVLCYQQSELICALQGMVIVAASIWTLRRYIKKSRK